MQKASVRKISISGAALIVASALVAAFAPSSGKSNNAVFEQNGSLTQNDEVNHLTCTATDGNFVQACHNTATAGANSGSSDAVADPTSNQTTGQDNS